jgi:hypothetical protein
MGCLTPIHQRFPKERPQNALSIGVNPRREAQLWLRGTGRVLWQKLGKRYFCSEECSKPSQECTFFLAPTPKPRKYPLFECFDPLIQRRLPVLNEFWRYCPVLRIFRVFFSCLSAEALDAPAIRKSFSFLPLLIAALGTERWLGQRA